MLETAWFLVRCLGFAAVCALLLLIVSCAARADPLADLGTACLQGNSNACLIYQSAVAQQQAQAQLYQQGVNNLTGYLTTQQFLANQRMQQPANHPVICTQQGVFTVCQ